MSQPHIAAKSPAKVTLEEGKKYFWCSCGLSENQPFCDGKHKGSAFSPKVIVAEKSGDVYLCQCKISNKTPYCDGKHKSL